MMRIFGACLAAGLLLSSPARAAEACPWPAWQGYKQTLLSADGRVIDPSSAAQITTSEGQSYGLFFALVANDRAAFDKILGWTSNNLAAGDLRKHLPAWQWGRDARGRWGVLDANNASDADLWIAYSLLEAGRLWQVPAYQALGRDMLWRSTAQTVRKLPGLGLMLLPGDLGFDQAGAWRLNPSYLPPQLLTRLGLESPVWQELADNGRRLLLDNLGKGMAPDWLMWREGKGWDVDASKGPMGSYDAIRVYLWIGMLDPKAPQRQALLDALRPMVRQVATGQVPEQVNARDGSVQGVAPAGFSAALLPLLAARPQDAAALAAQRQHLADHPPAANAYYDQSLTLFGQGWDQQRYRFDPEGRLLPRWTSCEN